MLNKIVNSDISILIYVCYELPGLFAQQYCAITGEIAHTQVHPVCAQNPPGLARLALLRFFFNISETVSKMSLKLWRLLAGT